MRDPIKVLKHRASKVPAIHDFISNIDQYELKDIEALDIKKSDKKLLRTHFTRFSQHHNKDKVQAWLLGAIEKMPTNDKVEMYNLYIYEGTETTYDGFEVRTGDVVTLHDDWIRFDYYRVKVRSSTADILNQCRFLDTVDITDANTLIFNMLNHRNGGTTTASGDQYLASPFRIQRN